MAVFDSWKRGAVLVVCDDNAKDKKYLGRPPLHVRRMLEGSATYPVVIVTDPTATRRIDAFCLKRVPTGEFKSRIRQIRKRLKKDPSLLAAPSAADPEPEKDLPSTSEEDLPQFLCDTRVWKNAQGKEMSAALISVSDGQARFLLSSGKENRYPIKQLAPEDQAFITNLQR